MKTCLYIFFCLSLLLLSNNKEDKKEALIINYTHSTHIEGLPSRTTVASTLISNDKFSLYEMDYLNNKNLIDEEDNEEGQVFLSIRTSSNPYIFKDLSNKTMYSTERIGVKPFLVKDSTKIFNWILTKVKKKILNFNCQQAKVNYRGRNYTAYFTTEINFKSGPWKFSDLPGTILEIKSDDNVFEIIANKVQILNKETNIVSPYKNLNEAISWEEFTLKYKKKYNELLSYRDENNVTMSIPKKKIEVFIEED
ncbi:MAG: GLPGLI family protein [Olleya sp.]